MKRKKDVPAGPIVAQTVKAIVDMSAVQAEKAIEAIADRNGDKYVKDILAHLPPVKIAAVLRQHDFSCPSIISWIMTPEIVVEILKIDSLFWKRIYDREDYGNFSKIQNEALDLIASILVNAKSRDQRETILQHISRDGLSLLYLLLPFIGWKIKESQTLEFEDPEIDFGTADHLYEMIRWAAPYVAKQIIDFVYSAEASLVFYITDLWSEAFNCFEAGRGFSSVENAMFMPVD